MKIKISWIEFENSRYIKIEDLLLFLLKMRIEVSQPQEKNYRLYYKKIRRS